jgi:O-antigen/teichoic acid export membrane protein
MRKQSSFILYSFGIIAPRLISLIIIPVFSFLLSQDELGLYDLLLSSINLFVPLISLQLGVACFRSARMESDINKKTDIIKTILVFSIFFHLILIIILLPISFCFDINHKIPFLFIVFLASFFSVLGSVARATYNQKSFVYSSIINSMGILIFSVFFIYLGKKGIDTIIYAYICTNILTIFFLIWSLEISKLFVNGHFSLNLLKESLIFSLPLIPNIFTRWFVDLANRYFITFFLGIGANGVFAVATKIPAILGVFGSIFLLILQDIAFTDEKSRKNDVYFVHLFKKIFIIQVASSLVILAFGKHLTSMLFAPEYSDTYRLIPLILAGSMFSNFAGFWAVFYQLEKKTALILKTNIYGAVTNCFITLILIKHIGLYAPALGTMIGFLIMWIQRMKFKKVNQKISLPINLIVKYLGIFLLFTFLFIFDNLYLKYIMMIASVVFFVYSMEPIVLSWKKTIKN